MIAPKRYVLDNVSFLASFHIYYQQTHHEQMAASTWSHSSTSNSKWVLEMQVCHSVPIALGGLTIPSHTVIVVPGKQQHCQFNHLSTLIITISNKIEINLYMSLCL